MWGSLDPSNHHPRDGGTNGFTSGPQRLHEIEIHETMEGIPACRGCMRWRYIKQGRVVVPSIRFKRRDRVPTTT